MFNVETTAEFKVWPININQANKHFTESQDPNKGMFQLCCTVEQSTMFNTVFV